MRYIKVFLLISTLLITSAAWPAVTATLNVPEAGNHYYWFTYTDLNSGRVTTTPRLFKDKKTSIDLPLVKDQVAEATLYVLDADTGNEAAVPVAGGEGAKEFKLASSDFDTVRRVGVEIVSAKTGQPAAAALVKMEIGGTVRTQVLDPSSRGIAEFSHVPAGTVKLTVEYGDGKSLSQDVDIPIDREEPVPMIQIPVAGEIETLQPSPIREGEALKTPSRAPAPKGMDMVSVLIGLIIMAGVVYGGFVLLRNRGASVRGALKHVGIDLPDDEPQPSSPAEPVNTDPGVCQFCGGRKDPSTGACACSVGADASPGASTGARLVVTQGPHMGGIFPIQGEVVIGREESNGIPLPQDGTVSRRHARVAGSGEEYSIRDEGSSNGTYVNGVKVTEQALRPGDEIQVGTTRMRFEA